MKYINLTIALLVSVTIIQAILGHQRAQPDLPEGYNTVIEFDSVMVPLEVVEVSTPPGGYVDPPPPGTEGFVFPASMVEEVAVVEMPARDALDLIKRFEGFRSRPYRCSAGVLTIGYGTTGRRIKGLDRVTRQQAEDLLRRHVDEVFGPAVDRLVTVPLTGNQRAALVSFTYNVGVGAFKRSTLLKQLNKGHYRRAANELLRWTNAGGRNLRGLAKRRQAERALFLSN